MISIYLEDQTGQQTPSGINSLLKEEPLLLGMVPRFNMKLTVSTVRGPFGGNQRTWINLHSLSQNETYTRNKIEKKTSKDENRQKTKTSNIKYILF